MDCTVDEVARVCHEVNRAYCATLGDHSQLPWDEAPEWARTSAMNGVSAIVFGKVKTPEESHESWLAEKAATGWKYGPAKDPEKKEHPCFRPYSELPAEQRTKDHLFRAVVLAMAGG